MTMRAGAAAFLAFEVSSFSLELVFVFIFKFGFFFFEGGDASFWFGFSSGLVGGEGTRDFLFEPLSFGFSSLFLAGNLSPSLALSSLSSLSITVRCLRVIIYVQR